MPLEYYTVKTPAGSQNILNINWVPTGDVTPLITGGLSNIRLAKYDTGTSKWIEVPTTASGTNFNGTATSLSLVTSTGSDDYTLGSITDLKPRAKLSPVGPVCGTAGIPVTFTAPFLIPFNYTLSYTIDGTAQVPVTITSVPYTLPTPVPGVYKLTDFTYSNGTLTGVVDASSISVYAVPTTSNAGLDQTLCGITTAILNGTVPVVGTGLWSIISGSGGTLIAPSNPSSQFIGLNGVSYTLRWTISNGTCTSFDDANINFTILPDAPAASGTQSFCGPHTVANLVAVPPTGCTVDWYSAASGGVLYPTATALVSGTTYYAESNGGGGCKSLTRTPVVVTINNIPVPGLVGPNLVCIGSTGNVYTTESGKSNYVWSVVGGFISSGGLGTDNTATVTWTTNGPQTISVNYQDVGGCTAAGPTIYNVTVNLNNTVNRTSPVGTDAQTVCINTAITSITYATTGATGATVTGLPAGVTGSWLANVVTISGTPTVSGPFTYTVTLTGGCGVVTTTGTITVTPNNTVNRTSPVGTDAQTVCINTAITSITYATTGATGATVTGLPAGVTGSWLANVVTISGTPTVSGPFTYTVTLTGGCGVVTTTGTITVTPNNTVNRTSPVGTDAQTVCINTAITSITYATTGATGATVTGLPAGVTGSWLANVVTISGTPTVSGPFTYTVTLTGGCGVVTTTGTITVTPNNTVNRTSPVGTDAQTVCINTAITSITYATTGATGATVTGLPAGVTGSWLANVVTISGTPTVSGPFTYTVTLTGGCGVVTTTGTITVTPNNTVNRTSPVGTDAQTVCINTAITSITYATTGATGATVTGLPAGVTGSWLANVVTISGTPTVSGPFTYTVTLTGGCGVVTTTGTITVTPNNTVNRTSPVGTDAQTVCINTAITSITYATTGATGATVTGLPAGVTGSWLANVVTISGTPTVSGPFTYTVTLTGGCGVVTTTGTITVTPNNTVNRTSPVGTDAQTVCINTAITSITYATTGATGATVTGLPAGVTGSWLANVVTISGTPTVSGPFTYTVTLTGGCGVVTTTGTITVTPNNTVNRTSPVGTDAQTVCINTAITSITYATTGATGATVTGLPAGVTGSWLANVVTISGTPTVSGPFTYTVTLTGGCGVVTTTGTITVTPNNTVNRTSPVGTDAQTVCINTAITSITYATTGATGATVTGLPAGVTGSWLANVVTISGTPTVSGPFTYTVTLTGGCGVVTTTGTITVTPNNTVNRTSPVGTDAQTVCINTAITSITYATTGATGATVTGLPAGVTGSWLANVVTISGTPTVSGPFTYTVTLTGGCGVVTTTGTITVTPNNTVNRTSPVGTDAQTVCINTAITNITYATTGATGATVTGLPAGVTGSWLANVVTISGTPTVSGPFTYTVTLTGGCGVVTTTGTITVTPNNTVNRTSPVGTDAQTVCINTAITSITYATTGATGATVTGLPAGVTGSWLANVVTISGTPTASGPFTYTVTLTGGCGVVTTTGTITVTPNNTVNRTSPVGTDAQTVCINTAITSITYATTGATGATVTGLPAGVTGSWLANVVTISGTPTVSGPFTYTVTLTGGCGVVTTTGTITVTPNNTVNRTSPVGTDAQTVCINTAITSITYATTGATGATVTGLPAGVTGSWLANVVTISGTPTVSGPFTYTVTLTGGCGVVTTTGTITVTPNNTVNRTSPVGTDAQTVCINTAITSITYATTGATGATVTGLPAGVTGSWLANVVTISGTPTVSGPFTYTVTLTGGCGVVTTTGTITVTPNNTVNRTSPVGTDAQTVCINTAITSITYATTGATGATVTGLPAGVTGSWLANVVTISGTPTVSGPFTYTVTLTGGCGVVTTTGTITVTPNNTVNRTSPVGTDAQTVCINTAITSITYATTGATGATVTGLPAGVTGSWLANVVTISGTPTVSGPFTYTVTLTGGCGVVTTTGTITVTPNNTVNRTSPVGTDAQTVCINTAITSITYATTGATGATVTGLPAGVTGSWLANVVTISGTPTVSGPFTYTVTLTGGCGVFTTTGTITINDLPTVTITDPAAVCTPATVDLTAAAVTAGSTAGLTYTYWTDAAGTIAYATPSTATAGTYYIKGSDPVTSCFDIKPVTVTVNALPTVTITDPAAVCAPATADLTVAAVTAGSTAGLTYTYWTDAAGTIAYATPATATAGTYYIKGSDPVTSCFDIKPVTVTVNALPTVTITDPAAVCAPATADLTAAAVTAGSAAGLTYTYWTDAAGTIAYATPATAIAGTYYIKGSDPVTSCFDIKPVTVTVNALPIVTITDPAAVCAPATADLTAAAVTAGSTAGLTYTYWTDAAGTIAYATPATATAGTYYIKGSDPVTSCFDIKPVTVIVNTSPSVTTTQVDVLCFGAMTGSATAVPIGGTGVYTYSWNTVPVQTSVTATGLAAGTYTVTVNDGICISTANVTINEPASALTESISLQTNVTVPGGNDGSVTVAGSGGTSPYLYKIGSGAYQASGTFGTLTAGIYTVTVQDINLCSFDITVTITEPSSVLSGSITSQTNVDCFGSPTGSVTVEGSGGVPPYEYSLNSGSYQASGTFASLAAGSYIITVRDAAMITSDVNFTITQPATSIGGSIISQTNILCSGSNTGSVTVSGSGGTPPYEYSLGGGSYQVSGTFGTLTAGPYTVTVRDGNLCTFDVPVILTEPAAALKVNTVSTTSAMCFGSSDGSIEVTGSGGVAPYMYSINGGTYLASGIFNNLTSATYTISVIDANLCTANVSIDIPEPVVLSVTNTKVDASCPGTDDGSITLTITGGTEPYTAIWSDGNNHQDRQEISRRNLQRCCD